MGSLYRPDVPDPATGLRKVAEECGEEFILSGTRFSRQPLRNQKKSDAGARA
jgi:hypothetical protein